MIIYLLDDDKTFLEQYVKLSKQVDTQISVKSFNNCDNFINELLRSEEKPDCIIIDIELGEFNGINVACAVNHEFSTLPIIFVTSYPEKYCQGIFLGNKDFTPFGFMTKPLQLEIINAVYSKLHSYIMTKPASIIVKSDSENIIINIDEILYVENFKSKANVHILNNVIISNEKMSNFIMRLPKYFICSHKSFWVNINKIKGFNNTDIELCNGEKVPLSRNKKKDFINSFTYLKGFCKC